MTEQPAPAPKLKITDETRAATALKADPKNARRHSEQQIAQIVTSIETFGYVNKIAIRPDNQIIGGHATLEALKRIGVESIDVRVVAGLTEPQYRKLAIALNKIPENSSWDSAILTEVLGELHDAGDQLDGIGFSEKELDGILGGGDDVVEVREVKTGDVADEFWISIRGPLKDQASALKALQAAMKPFPEVAVDLGTIAIEQE